MIVVNARFLTQPITGVQRYGIEISLELKKINPKIIFVTPRNIIHHDIAKALEAIPIGYLKGHAWEQVELPLFLKRNNTPLLVNLANTAPIFYYNKVSTIHDIAFEKFPQNFSWKFRKFYQLTIPIIIKTSRKIFTVSEFSKKEITSLYKISTSEIQVVPNAASNIFTRTPSIKQQEKYVLAVSSLTYQKNFIALIDAFNLLNDKSHKLLLVGSINRNFASKDLIAKIDSNHLIKFTGRVSDVELVSLYSDATAFIHPSLYEGFGIPPLEAQACGCPVICSNTASLPEVCNDSALYFDPYNTLDIANKIDSFLAAPEVSAILVEKGYKNITRFSWEHSANTLLATLKDL